MSDIDPIRPIQTTLLQGETCIFIERKPLQLREEKPYKPP
jgi:hypothetical protein